MLPTTYAELIQSTRHLGERYTIYVKRKLLSAGYSIGESDENPDHQQTSIEQKVFFDTRENNGNSWYKRMLRVIWRS